MPWQEALAIHRNLGLVNGNPSHLMDLCLRFITLVILYASINCLALLLGGALVRFADYQSPAPEWKCAILSGITAAGLAILLEGFLQNDLRTHLEIRQAHRQLTTASLLILLSCHMFAFRSGDRADFAASGAILGLLYGACILIVPLHEWLHPWVETKSRELEKREQLLNTEKLEHRSGNENAALSTPG